MKDSSLLGNYEIIGDLINSEHRDLIKRMSLAPRNDGAEAADTSAIESVCNTGMSSFAFQF